MFVQVIQGRTEQPDELKAAGDRWTANLGPGAQGWQSTTAGVADDGTAVIVVSFDSEASARRNSERPEQHQWWMETAKLFGGDVAFMDCTDVLTYGEAPAPGARFVQVMQARLTDPGRLAELSQQVEPYLSEERPDLLGYLAGLETGGSRATQVAYFVSEADARLAEKRKPSPEMQKLIEEEQSLFQDTKYIDLKDPWISTS